MLSTCSVPSFCRVHDEHGKNEKTGRWHFGIRFFKPWFDVEKLWTLVGRRKHKFNHIRQVAPLCSTTGRLTTLKESPFLLVMVALYNRADHYIFIRCLSFFFFFFSSPNLSGRRLDVYHTMAPDVALVRI